MSVPALKRLSLCINQEDYHDVDFNLLIYTPMLDYIYIFEMTMVSLTLSGAYLPLSKRNDLGMHHYDKD